MDPNDIRDKALKSALSGPAEFDALRSWEALSHKLAGPFENGVEAAASSELQIGSQIADSDRTTGRPKTFFHSTVTRYAVAASVLIAVAVFANGEWLSGLLNFNSISNAETRTYTTQIGQRATVTLSDGTTATLAPATTLVVRGKSVELTGQAMFVVLHRSEAPFVVNSRGASVRVLGTTFEVRAYKEDTAVRVAVAQGKVMVKAEVLANGDIAVVTPTNVEIDHNAERVASMLGWAQGELMLDRITLAEAVPDLERWYGIKINVSSDELANKLLRIKLNTESATQALNIIAAVSGARYEQKGRVVTLYQE